MSQATASAGTDHRSAAVAVAGYMIAPLASLITQPLLARGLGVVGRGEVAATLVPLVLVAQCFTLGLPEAMTHFVAKRSADGRLLRRTLVWLVGAGLVGTIVIILLSPYLSGGSDTLRAHITSASILAPALLVNTGIMGIAAGRGKWARLTVGKLIQALLIVSVLAGLLLAQDLTVDAAVWTSLLAQVVPGALCASMLWARPDLRRRTLADPRSVLRYGRRMWLGSAAGILNMRLDQLLVVPLSNVTQLGLYSVSAGLSEVVLVVNSGLRDVIFPLESRAPNPGRAATAARVSSLLVGLLSVGVAAVGTWAVPAFFGGGYRASLPSLYILVVAVFVGNFGSIPGAAMAGWGRPELRSYALAISLAVNAACLVALVPHFGAVGAALAALCSNSVVAAWNVRWFAKLGGVSATSVLIPRRSDACLLVSGARAKGARKPKSVSHARRLARLPRFALRRLASRSRRSGHR